MGNSIACRFPNWPLAAKVATDPAPHISGPHPVGSPQPKQDAAWVNSQIVNPARLTPYLADNICMSCHQTGDVRVLKTGKTYRISPRTATR